jgi:eukaryotic-like serine/threonine-protein kinase
MANSVTSSACSRDPSRNVGFGFAYQPHEMAAEAPGKCGRCGRRLTGSAGDALCRVCLLEEGLCADAPDRDAHNDPTFTNRRFGTFEILGEIGQGGMGVVYRARQPELGREIALKLLLLGRFSGADAEARFRREAVAAAKLRHPNIVTVHEVGEVEGQPYIAMEWVPGRDLERVVREGTLKPNEAARMAATLCDALQHAHERGVIHRDLKPSNVLIDERGEPRLTDFGLAHQSDTAHPTATVTGQVLGSPGFLSPEQVTASTAPTVAVDVYGLGATLYFALTGHAPITGSGLAQTLRRVTETDPVPPVQLNPDIPADLDLITLRCLAKNPAKRFARAADLGHELRCFLEGRPITTRPVPAIERAFLWCRRHPAHALAMALCIALAIGGPVAALSVQHERVRAEQLAAESRNRLISVLEERAGALCDAGGAADALPWLVDALSLARDDPTATARLRMKLGVTGALAPRLVRLWRMDAPLKSAWFSDSGDVVILWTEPSGEVPAMEGKSVLTGLTVPVSRPPGGARAAIAISRSRDAGLFPAQEGVLLRRRIGLTNTVERSLPVSGKPGPAAFSPDSALVAIADDTDGFAVWDTVAGHRLSGPWQLTNRIDRFVFSADGKRLAVQSGEQFLRVWDLVEGRMSRNLGRFHPVVTAAFSPQGDEMLVGSRDGQADIWNVFRVTRKFDIRHDVEMTAAAWSPAGPVVATAGHDGRVAAWDIGTRLDTVPHIAGSAPVRIMEFSRDGGRLLTADDHGLVRVWDIGPRWTVLPAPDLKAAAGGAVTNAAAGWSARLVARGQIRLSDPATGTPLGPPVFHRGALGLRINAQGHLVSRAEDGEWLWELRTETRSFEGLRSWAALLAARRTNPSGQLVPLTPAELAELGRNL